MNYVCIFYIPISHDNIKIWTNEFMNIAKEYEEYHNLQFAQFCSDNLKLYYHSNNFLDIIDNVKQNLQKYVDVEYNFITPIMLIFSFSNNNLLFVEKVDCLCNPNNFRYFFKNHVLSFVN